MNTKEKIAVMQAWVDGKKVQFRMHGGTWADDSPTEPNWNWAMFEWRIKPEPREWRVYINNGKICDASCHTPSLNGESIKVREVLE